MKFSQQSARNSSVVKTITLAFSVAAMLALAWPARATLILVKPTRADALSTSTGFGGPEATIDSSGFSSAPIYPTGYTPVPGPGTWAAQTVSATTSYYWISDIGAQGSQWIKWDLGATYTISGFHYWNLQPYTGESGRGITGAHLQIGTDWNFGLGTYTDLGSITLVESTADGDTGTDFLFAANALAPTAGEFIRLSNLTDRIGTYFGLQEIRFDAETIPEPSTVMLFGIGAGILWLRRRNRQAGRR